MPKEPNEEAVKLARQLYCKHGGKNFDAIEKAMRLAGYEGWNKACLKNRGAGVHYRAGWIEKYGFDKSLELDQQTRIGAVESDDERRYRAVVKLADHYQDLSLNGDEKAVDKFIKLTQQQIELRSKLDVSSANFQTFVESFEQIVAWAEEIDSELAKRFYRRKDEFIERASEKYGTRQQSDG